MLLRAEPAALNHYRRVTSDAAILGRFYGLHRSGLSADAFPMHLLPRLHGSRFAIGFDPYVARLRHCSNPNITSMTAPAPRIHAYVAHAQLGSQSNAAPVGPIGRCASHHHDNMVAHHDGIKLHLSSKSSTGYERVSFVAARRMTPYRAKSPDGKLLGYFATAVDAAVCYAQCVATNTTLHCSTEDAACNSRGLAQSAVTASGETIRLHLSSRSVTGYRGVTILSGNRVKPFAARLGPSATDVVGHYSTAVEAAVAVACAIRARDSLLDEMASGDDFAPISTCLPPVSVAALTVPLGAPLCTDSIAGDTLDVDTLLCGLGYPGAQDDDAPA